jgi:hypothetical protein
VWWEGNQAYLEADVYGYNPFTGKHKLKYVIDSDEAEENLVDLKSQWEWLDESKEELSIKKRSRTDPFVAADGVLPIRSQTPTIMATSTTSGDLAGRSSSGANTSSGSFKKANTYVPKVRKTVPIAYNVAYFMTSNRIVESRADRGKDADTRNAAMIEALTNYCSRQFDGSLKAIMGKTVDEHGLISEVILFGPESAVSEMEQAIGMLLTGWFIHHKLE